MPQPRLMVNAHQLVDEINDMSASNPAQLHWGIHPNRTLICAHILDHADRDGLIEYGLCMRILQAAETTKLLGGANKGLNRAKQWATRNKVKERPV